MHKSMKTIGVKIITFLSVFLLMSAVWSCTEADEDVAVDEKYTYRMHLEGGLTGTYHSETKAVAWEDETVIYLQFMKDSYSVTGVAEYDYDEDVWIVEVDEELDETDADNCEAYYFADPVSATSMKVHLNENSAVYGDQQAAYSLRGDQLVVKGYLTPMTSRIRFHGVPGTMIEVSGMLFYSLYNLTQNKFTECTDKMQVQLNEEGWSEHIYAVFADQEKREMVFYDEGKRGFVRSFPSTVLTVGTSGYLNVPTLEAMEGWTVVNVDNMQEVTLPQFGEVAVLEARSKSIKVSAAISDLGNGNLLEMGFICSTSSKPTFENGKKYSCEPSMDVLCRLRGLEPEVRYYLVAYAVNERGFSCSRAIRFETGSEDDESVSVDFDEYDEDENWGGDTPSDGSDLEKDDYPDDENWN